MGAGPADAACSTGDYRNMPFQFQVHDFFNFD
jgi:hypothetical protein